MDRQKNRLIYTKMNIFLFLLASVKLEKGLAETGRLTEAKTKQKKWNYIPSSFGCGRDYFQGMFHSHQKQILSKPRPQSSSVERKMPSNFHDYTVSASR